MSGIPIISIPTSSQSYSSSSPSSSSSVVVLTQRAVRTNLSFFLFVLIISLVVYTAIQYFSKSECQDSTAECSKTWDVMPPGTVMQVLLYSFAYILIIWFIFYFLIYRITFN